MAGMKKSGFTLIEVLFTFGILAFCVCGVLLTYIQMFMLADLSRDTTLATNAAQAKMEEIKKTVLTGLDSSHCDGCSCPSPGFRDGCIFDITGFTGTNAKGKIEISDITLRTPATETLKRVRIVVSFTSRGRVFGEDRNLNGILDIGEDRDAPGQPGYGRLDSPLELITLIAR